MGLLRIHCDSCGGSWEVYGRDDWKDARCRTCPHCLAEIDAQDWQKQILPAFAALADANRELMKTHTGWGDPLFTVDYIEDHHFRNTMREAKAAAEALQADVDGLRETVDTLTNAIMTAAIMKEGETLV